MKRILFAIVAIAALSAVAFGATRAGATEGDRAPYCSAQELTEGPKAATEPYQVTSYDPEEHDCKPVPPATSTDHVCGFRGYVTIFDHNEHLVDYFIDDVKVDAGQHPQELGATVHVTAEVKYDGNDEVDYHAEFVFSTPNCTGQPGTPGQPGAPGTPGTPGPVTIIQPQPARPIIASPTTTG